MYRCWSAQPRGQEHASGGADSPAPAPAPPPLSSRHLLPHCRVEDIASSHATSPAFSEVLSTQWSCFGRAQ